jgi:hypothetical protein|tara:strand:+ start:450 stop:665 length:216 start_codon:yes stop_codon:yes gene_type:complete
MHYDQWKLQPPPYMCESADECEICGYSGSENLERNQDDILDQNDGRLLCEECIESVNEKYKERINSVGEVI